MKEQYPVEIEERRKLLYGEANAARQNTNNKVRLVRDKLYINGQQYIQGLTKYQSSSNRDTRQNDTNNTNSRNNLNSSRYRVRFDRNVNDMSR